MVGYDTIFLYKHEDGNWSDHADDFHNRGFLFGDGLFETMVFSLGKFRFADFHWERLLEGIRVLGLDPMNLSSLNDLENLLSEIWGDKKTLRVRWNIYRGGSGKYTPEVSSILESIQVQSFLPAPEFKEKAYLSPNIHLTKTPWSHCKTLSALTYVMANNERKNRGFDEVILSTPDGSICEAGSSNLFWIKDGQYFTPSLESGCLAGIGRRLIIDFLKEKNSIVHIGLFKIEDLLDADQVFTTNVTGISYIRSIENKEFNYRKIQSLDTIFKI
jgi:4-amino-4-deoxychorismate lyase